MSHVAWSVYLCVAHTGDLCKNGRTDRDAVLGADFCWLKKSCAIRRSIISDESIRSREGWQVDDAVFCQITLGTCLYFILPIVSGLVTCYVRPS